MSNCQVKILLFALMAVALMPACRRSYPDSSRVSYNGSGYVNPPPPPPPGSTVYPRTLKAMVLEYGTNRPLSDVESIILSGNQPDVQTTDSNGVCYFQQRPLYFRTFRKAGYWNANMYPDQYNPVMLCPIQSFPLVPPSLIYYNNGFSCDSFNVTLFQEKNIQVHVKDSLHLSSCTDCNVIMAVNALFTNNGTNYTVFSGGSYSGNGMPILLRPGIDSSFTLHVFGNALNIISIGEDDAGNGWHGFWNYFRKDTIMISSNMNSLRLAF